MLVLRSFAVGLSAAFFALLVMRPSVVVVRDRPGIPATFFIERDAKANAPVSLPPTIVDVAPGVSPDQLSPLLRLAPGERIAYANDVAVPADLPASFVFAQRASYSGKFFDLVVSGPAGDRRVLVLMH